MNMYYVVSALFLAWLVFGIWVVCTDGDDYNKALDAVLKRADSEKLEVRAAIIEICKGLRK